REVEPEPEASSPYALATSIVVYFSCVTGVGAIAEGFLAKIAEVERRAARIEPIFAGWAAMARSYHAQLLRGEPFAALRLAEEAAAGFMRAGDQRGLSLALLEIGLARHDLGDHLQAEHTLRDCASLTEALGLRLVTPVARHRLGRVRASRGAFEEAQ